MTTDERRVFDDVRAFWGPGVSEDDLFFVDSQGAMIAPTARDGSIYCMIGLTTLSDGLADGTWTRWEVRESIMGPFSPERSSGFRLRRAWRRVTRSGGVGV